MDYTDVESHGEGHFCRVFYIYDMCAMVQAWITHLRQWSSIHFHSDFYAHDVCLDFPWNGMDDFLNH